MPSRSSPAFRSGGTFSPERLEALQQIYTVKRYYLDAMLGAIAAHDGSGGRFPSRTLELDASVLSSVRARLL